MIHSMHGRRWALSVACAAIGLLSLGAPAATAQSIIDSWSSVAVPPPPPLLPASVDSASTALLVLDMNATSCTTEERPSCFRSITHVERLLTSARSHQMMVVYSTGPATNATPPKTPVALTPKADDPIVRTGADKFVNSDLEKILAARGIKTVIVVGTSAQGAVLYTASAAALRGLSVIVPVDGYSSESPFAELYTAWHLKNAPSTISSRVTLSRSDMITMR